LQLSESKVLEHYINLPKQILHEFWSISKIMHIRSLAERGKAIRLWTPPEELSSRPLDRLRFRAVRDPQNPVDSRVTIGSGRIDLSAPIYFADMSFGSLSGIPNIALAKAADITGTLAGTGEGGLHPEVAKATRITVQWASARFGVDIDVLNKGLAVVIKIGQGAKPGIGGHLPGAKVTEPISRARRIPIGKPAISPSPHHDIYSIEDLGRRIEAIKEATGKPVFVKVGATNYVHYIATGVARMGGDGIILDGAGGGTGASPLAVRENIGLPIEIAVASVDTLLRKEGLREGFTVVAAGRVSNAEDSAKLLALGADCVYLGTAPLIALGCIMCHQCHTGYCPTLLTNKITSNTDRILSLDKAVERLTNLVRGWTEELELIVSSLGLRTVSELVGRRDLLEAFDMWDETACILGIKLVDSRNAHRLANDEGYWSQKRVKHLRELSGVYGQNGGEPAIASTGSIGPPFVDAPQAICDYLYIDGAQVTRPSIDPYREVVETTAYVSGIRLSLPLYFARLKGAAKELIPVFAKVAKAMNLMLYIDSEDYSEHLSNYLGRILYATNEVNTVPRGVGAIVIDNWCETKPFRRAFPATPLYVRVPPTEESLASLPQLVRKGFDGIIVDNDLTLAPIGLDLAVMTSEVDWALRELFYGGVPVRNQLNLLCGGSAVRGSDDIFKLMCLGADAVGLSEAALIALGYKAGEKFDIAENLFRLENLILSLKGEIRLLSGASGVSSIYTSVVGNRELLRSVDLEPSVRKRLRVKAAGT
jgi:glutamate synthase domain-containing protein 2